MPAQHHVPRNRFVKAGGFEAISPWQVDQAVGRSSTGAYESALLALDSDSWVVRDLLSAAGEAIEQSRLAAVRNSYQRQDGRLAWVQRRHYRRVHKGFPGREISTPSGASNGG